jgi:hypothetical protein
MRFASRNDKYPVSKASPISKKGELKIRRPICYGKKNIDKILNGAQNLEN